MFKLTVLFVTVSLFLTTSVAATASEREQKAKARKFFEKGISEFEVGRYKAAAENFRAANALKYNWKILYNIAQAEAAGGRSGIALQTFEKYLASGGDNIEEERQKEILTEIDRLRKLVGAIEFKVPAHTKVIVDDMVRGVAPLPGLIMVSTGISHSVRLELDGATVHRQEVVVSVGQTRVVMYPGDRDSRAKAENTDAADRSKSNISKNESTVHTSPPISARSNGNGRTDKLNRAGWSIVAAGGVALVAGVTLGALTLKKRDTIFNECGDGASQACSADSQNALDDGRGFGTASTILFISGGVVLTTGLVLLMAGKKREKNAVSLTLLAAPPIAGFQLSGRF